MESSSRQNTGIRWEWSKKAGLQKIRKTGIEKNGKWLRKQNVEVLNEPVRNPDEIAKILFRGKVGSEVLNSLESIIDGIKKAYTPKEQEERFKRMAWSFSTRGLVDNLPPEIVPYLDDRSGHRIFGE